MTVAKALVVDDSRVAHLTLRKLLMERSMEVDWVGSGEASLDYLKHQTPDVVFMDIMMPGMDGFETLQALHRDPNITVPQIVMCSANATSEDRLLAEQHGAVAFLTKPYTGAELDKLLENLATAAPSAPATSVAQDEDDLQAALSRYETPSTGEELAFERPSEPQPLSSEPLKRPSAPPQPTPKPTPRPATQHEPAITDGQFLERADLESLIHEIAESVNRKNAEVMMHAVRQASTRTAESVARKLIEERVPRKTEPPVTEADLQSLRQDLNQTLAQQVQAQLEQQIQPQVEAAVQASIGAAVEQALEHTLASERFAQQLDQRIRTTALAAAEGQSRDIANKVVRDMLAEQPIDADDSSSGAALAVGGLALVLAIAALGLAVANWLGII